MLGRLVHTEKTARNCAILDSVLAVAKDAAVADGDRHRVAVA